MKFVFLNLYYGGFEKELIEFINEQKTSTDVFCFQESSDKLQKIFETVLSEYTNENVQEFKEIDDGYFVSTYVKNRYKILKHVPLFADEKMLGLGQKSTISNNFITLTIDNIHGVWKPEGSKEDTNDRLKQSNELVKRNGLSGEIKIVGGDFNLNQETESIKIFEKNGYVNLIKKFGIKTTRNEYAWKDYPNNKHYFSDYVFVSPEVRVKSFEVPEMTISDHLPMILEIED